MRIERIPMNVYNIWEGNRRVQSPSFRAMQREDRPFVQALWYHEHPDLRATFTPEPEIPLTDERFFSWLQDPQIISTVLLSNDELIGVSFAKQLNGNESQALLYGFLLDNIVPSSNATDLLMRATLEQAKREGLSSVLCIIPNYPTAFSNALPSTMKFEKYMWHADVEDVLLSQDIDPTKDYWGIHSSTRSDE